MRTLLLLALFAGPVAAQAVPILLNGSIWDGNGGPLATGNVYHIVGSGGSCGISVPLGQTLTIQPGAIIKIGGCVGIRGTVNAIGTPSQRITFTSIHDDTAGGDTNGNGGATTPAPGDWGQIDVGGLTTFEWCNWSYGGSPTSSAFNLRLQPHVFRDCKFEHMAKDVMAGAWYVEVERCAFNHIGGIPVRDLHLASLDKFWDNTATQCAGGEYAVIVRATGFLGNLVMDHRLTLNGSGVFVWGANNLSPSIPAGTHMTLPAGTVFKFGSGFVASSGSLIAQGTAAEPVVFTSLHDDAYGGDTQNNGNATVPAPGDWSGIQLNTGDSSDLQHAVIRYAGVGSNSRAVYAHTSSAVLSHTTIEHSNFDGIAFSNIGLPPMQITDCTFRHNSGLAVRNIKWGALARCWRNSSSNNGSGDHFRVAPERPSSAIVIAPGNFPGDVLEVGGKTTFYAGGSLTLPAGTILKFPSRVGSGFYVSYSTAHLHLQGTARRPVVLTSFKDDSWGGDTNGDGAASQPVPNDIGRIGFGLSCGASSLENVLVRYGTSSSIESSSSNVALRSVRVDYSYGAGIRLHRAQGDVVNAVAYGCNGNGFELHNGTYDLLHATAANNGLVGIKRTSLWSGQVINSNSWGNTGGNIDVPAGQLTSSNGVGPALAGQNGNTDFDPQFEDQANGDLHLQATSPCLGAAELAAALLVQKDHDETSRLQDHALTGSLLPDMGAYERAAYRLDVGGAPVLGTTMTFTLQGPAGIGAVFLSLSPGPAVLVPPLGYVLIGYPFAPLAPSLLTPGQAASFDQPAIPGFAGVRFAVQGVGLQLGGALLGGLTNVDRNELRLP